MPYEVNDNDFYWLNSPDEETFYIIPEKKLIDEEYIKSQNNKGKLILNISTCDWISDYQFNYTDIDLETHNKFIRMF